jgi:hypothetical protein
MEKLTKSLEKINTKQKVNTNTNIQKLLQEKKKTNVSFEENDIDYGLGHIYGSW